MEHKPTIDWERIALKLLAIHINPPIILRTDNAAVAEALSKLEKRFQVQEADYAELQQSYKELCTQVYIRKDIT